MSPHTANQHNGSVALRRHIAGIVALLALALAAATWMWPWDQFPMLSGVCFRISVLFAVVWLAFDEVQRLPGWIAVVMPVFLLLLVFRSRWALLALPVLILIAALRPRQKAR